MQKRLGSGMCSCEGKCEYEFHVELLPRVSLSLTAQVQSIRTCNIIFLFPPKLVPTDVLLVTNWDFLVAPRSPQAHPLQRDQLDPHSIQAYYSTDTYVAATP